MNTWISQGPAPGGDKMAMDEKPLPTRRVVAIYAFLALVVFSASVFVYYSADKQTREDYAACGKEGLATASDAFQTCLARYRNMRFQAAKAAPQPQQ
jgi:hypothetical protein